MTRLLFTGATVWAGATCTPRPAWLLVEDDRVAALGEHEQPPPADDVLDLVGCHVLPGFVDVHLHLSQAAWFPRGGDALGWRGLADALRAVRVAAGAEPDAPWLLFWCAARFAWPEGRLPTAAELDQAAPGRRVLISTLDMHRGAVSSAGLAALGFPGTGWHTSSAATSPGTGVGGRPARCGRRRMGWCCNGRWPTPRRTRRSAVPRPCWPARLPAAWPTASPTRTTPTCHQPTISR